MSAAVQERNLEALGFHLALGAKASARLIISFTTVISAGREVSTTSYPSSIMRSQPSSSCLSVRFFDVAYKGDAEAYHSFGADLCCVAVDSLLPGMMRSYAPSF